ncbi:GFA family protein [Hoeflea ulvae]|uniref:GFA family protein n=1 Tax=Hoeflea ulvae TaxID=2983764 RepID=A0ABT3YIP6_9HYPH|nr:GFA family protein [Hoeflea ulvae]MCY0095770.1 GFA family protein [Hoeflea ulvae]
MSAEIHSGGCQCGAVRFRLTGAPGTSSVCYCRMCQKASASQALALVSVGEAAIEWTRGAPSWFQSSDAVRRGFCSACGTPLAYDAPDGLALTVLAFDDPDTVPPTIAYGVEGKRIWCDGIPSLPERQSLEDPDAVSFLKTLISYQHPDRDTEAWPPEPKT